MWHYVEGIKNWSPIWSDHAIRIIPGPSSLWLDARGRRLPVPLYPGFDTLGDAQIYGETGYDYCWFILTRKIIEKEFALSGSEQNPDLTSKSWRQVIARARAGIPGPVKAFMDKGEDFIVEHDLARLVERMNALVGGEPLLDLATVEREIVARDRQLDNAFGKDMQIAAIRAARRYLGDKLTRAAMPHKLLDPAAGPLIAVRLHILTRKTLGGLQTDLEARVLGAGRTTGGGLVRSGRGGGLRRRWYARLSRRLKARSSAAVFSPAASPAGPPREVSGNRRLQYVRAGEVPFVPQCEANESRRPSGKAIYWWDEKVVTSRPVSITTCRS